MKIENWRLKFEKIRQSIQFQLVHTYVQVEYNMLGGFELLPLHTLLDNWLSVKIVQLIAVRRQLMV